MRRLVENKELWKNKKIFIIATMGLFSGDGAGVLGRLLQKYGADILGGLHIKMPDSIGDEKVLKRPFEKNREIVKTAEQKSTKAVQSSRCTLCYRCINNCPKQAMTLLGKEIVEQSVIEKYLG